MEFGDSNWSFNCKLRAGSDCWPIEGGVREPLVGVLPWLASLAVSVDRSVLKLALDRLRSSLKFRKDGAMAPDYESSLLASASDHVKGTNERGGMLASRKLDTAFAKQLKRRAELQQAWVVRSNGQRPNANGEGQRWRRWRR